ncbi:hypothetical protein F5B20DRAFT_343376 [Whalleya microplaca]|nr:hypothetical protein F5B20DRAFT_343376 [Whalleya microplaca]
MNSLPPEVLQNFAERLRPTDLRSLRLVDKTFAAVAARPLFEVIHFNGVPQQDRFPYFPEAITFDQKHIGPKRTVEYSQLHHAISEVLPLAPYVKTFIFSPFYYREGFWQDYGLYLASQAEEPVDPEDIPDAPEDYEDAVESVIQERLSRPEREAPLIEAGKRTWVENIAKQNANAQKVIDFLARFFEASKRLEKIEINPCEFEGYQGLHFYSFAVDSMRNDSSSTTVDFLDMLGTALQSVNRHIKSLCVTEPMPELINDTSANRHIFTGLTHLRLDTTHVEFMLKDAPISQNFVELFKCAQPTLRSLEIIGGGKWLQLPSTGEHSLLKMLCDGTPESPLVFPKLQRIYLCSLILSTPPLMKFITSQPNLTSIEVGFVFLSTPSFGWRYFAKSLPISVKSWKIRGRLGHEPIANRRPADPNWMREWIPSKDLLSDGAGWKITATRPFGVTAFRRV